VGHEGQEEFMNATLSRGGLVSLVLLLVCGSAGAATLEVAKDGSAPFLTIQSAIDAALAGQDDVFVYCGVYTENIVMRSQISVRGEDEDCTIIDGGQAGSVVTMTNIDSSTVLEGFTIRNGRAGLGGGIFVSGGAPTISGNVIKENQAIIDGAFTGTGGGIHITEPLAEKRALGIAPLITRNLILDNVAEAFGGGIEIYGGSTTISNNLIENNTAAETGGGIDVFFNGDPSIVNNTIVRNCVGSCAQGGGAIAVANAFATIENNVIAWNEAQIGGGGTDLVGSGAVFTANDSYQNTPANYVPTDPTGMDGNVSVDPRFDSEVRSRKGYTPRSDSDLIDTADAFLAPPVDLRGVLRPVDGDASGTSESDIGARENEGVTRLVFPDKTALAWDDSVGPGFFNVYRGDLQVLRDQGLYVQDPLVVLGAEQFCGLLLSGVTDIDVPDPGQVYFYLVVIDDVIEGTLGFDSVPTERPYSTPRCP
jgi:parallel beta-helix repeat protein